MAASTSVNHQVRRRQAVAAMFDDEAGNWCEARVGFEPVPKIGAVPHFEKQLIERPFAQPMGLPGEEAEPSRRRSRELASHRDTSRGPMPFSSQSNAARRSGNENLAASTCTARACCAGKLIGVWGESSRRRNPTWGWFTFF
jgi:hypothetical protein